MSLRRCMREHTERELRVWLAWMALQWDSPDRSDYYLMQVACEVRRVLSRDPRAISISDFKLQFREAGPAVRRDSKAAWFAGVGLAREATDGRAGAPDRLPRG